jgi:glycosyltransferase involved in cell wall biosynthesis
VSKPCVLIVVENLPVPLDRRVWQEASALRDAGHKVVIICPKMRGYNLPEETIDGIQIYRHWIAEEARSFAAFFLEYFSAIFGELRLAVKAWWRHRFKIIHICNPPDLLFLVTLPFKLLGVRVIFDVHDVVPEMFEAKFGRKIPFYWLVRWAERLTYACADVVIATNDSVKKVAVQRGKKKADKVFVVRTAPKINPADWPPDESLRKGRKFLVGFVGVMGSADGVSYLLDAVAHLVNKLGHQDVQFLLMGTGPEYQRLILQRDRLNVADFVDMPGGVANEFLFKALRTMDLGVSCDPVNTYNNQCTMNKVLEYMTFGKAQVMFDLKEGRASAGDAAIYVPDNSTQKMALAIERLLHEQPLREKMGRIGLDRIQNELKWENSVLELYKAYDCARPLPIGT